jgi:hypothetical protein
LSNDKPEVLPPFAAAYLKSRVLNEPSNGKFTLVRLRRIAEKLQEESANGTSIQKHLEKLCPLVMNSLGPAALAHLWGPDKTMRNRIFDRHLFVAAVHTQTTPVIDQWIASGNSMYESSWLFGSVARYAARNGDEDFLKRMMNYHNKSSAEESRITLLSAVAKEGRAGVIQFVYEYSARQYPWEYSREKEPRMPWKSEWTLWDMHTSSREVFDWLMEKRKEHCIDRTFDARQCTEFLLICAWRGWADMAACYLDLGAAVDGMDVLARYNREKRPLIRACSNGHESVVKVLLRYGANISSPALEIAAGNGRLDIVRLLLEHGAEFGDALERAAAGGYRDVVEELLGLDADIKGCSGDLLLHAVQYEQVAMFRLWVERGCDPREADTMARCVKAAEDQGLESMLEFLKAL